MRFPANLATPHPIKSDIYYTTLVTVGHPCHRVELTLVEAVGLMLQAERLVADSLVQMFREGHKGLGNAVAEQHRVPVNHRGVEPLLSNVIIEQLRREGGREGWVSWAGGWLGGWVGG